MEWLTAHWQDILATIGAVDTALFLIVKLTPTKWDDNAFAFVHYWVVRIFPPK